MQTAQFRNDDKFVAELQDCAKLLIDKLQKNDFNEASNVIQHLLETRDRHIFQTVGQLTRALHNAIVNFNVDSTASEKGNVSEISDASDRLQYVIKMTQEAADKTMDRVEVAAPIAVELGEEAQALKAEWNKLKRREISKDEFSILYTRVNTFLDKMGDGTAQLNENLQAIILEQGFQDLTGQVLRRVIGLVTDVERELVNLVRIAGQVEDVAGISPDKATEKLANNEPNLVAEGPHIHNRSDIVNGQDDVDDLLSSLGF